MNPFGNLTVEQLRRAIEISETIEDLQAEIAKVLGGEIPIPHISGRKGRKKISAAGRAWMAAAQRARRSKVKGEGVSKAKVNRKRTMSAAARARMSAAAKERWKLAKAAGKTRL